MGDLPITPDGPLVVRGRTFTLRTLAGRGSRITARASGDLIVVRMPPGMTREAALRQREEILQRLLAELHKQPVLPAGLRTISYEDGQSFELLGRSFQVVVWPSSGTRSSAELVGNAIRVTPAFGLSPGHQQQHIDNLVRRIVSATLQPQITARVQALNARHFGYQVGTVTLRDQRTRWGSCSGRGNISLNFRLLYAPDEVLDYVIIHELAHLREQNHGPAFWALVAGAMPTYQEAQAWLQQNGNSIGATDGGEV